MIFLALKTEDGRITGKISFYCQMLGLSRQGFYQYLANKDRPWKYQDLADAMKEIISENECNDTYGRIRMYQALLLVFCKPFLQKITKHFCRLLQNTFVACCTYILQVIANQHHPSNGWFALRL